jgi:mRNA-degrading endonuclease RelE of RelBE toxin-antitoxin system
VYRIRVLETAVRELARLDRPVGQRIVERIRWLAENQEAIGLLRPLIVFAERAESSSKNPGDAKLELGDHRISQELRDLHLGGMVGCQYTPSMQTILTPVLESFAA